jgi:hypothetical protein
MAGMRRMPRKPRREGRMECAEIFLDLLKRIIRFVSSSVVMFTVGAIRRNRLYGHGAKSNKKRKEMSWSGGDAVRSGSVPHIRKCDVRSS